MNTISQKQIDFIKKLESEKGTTFNRIALFNQDYQDARTLENIFETTKIEELSSYQASILIGKLLKAPKKEWVEERIQRRNDARDTAFEKHAKLVEFAKNNGVKVTKRTSQIKIAKALREANIEFPKYIYQ